MALISSAIITVTAAREYLGLSSLTTAQTTRMQNAINAATVHIESRIGRAVKTRQFTEYYDGSGDSTLYVKNFPIAGVTALYDDVDRVYSAGTAITAGDYILYADRGRIELDDTVFNAEQRNIKVIYTAGLGTAATIPGDISEACCVIVRNLWNQVDDTMQSESIGSYSYSRSLNSTMVGGADSLLASYIVPKFPMMPGL